MMLPQEMNLFFLFSKQVRDCWFSRGGMREIPWTNFVSCCSPTQNREIVPGSVQSIHLILGRERNKSNSLRRNNSYFCNAHSILDKLPLHRGAWQQSRSCSHNDLLMYLFQVTNTGVTPYDKVGSSYQQSVF